MVKGVLMARPTKMTKDTLGKLEQAFAYDSTIEEACFFADINPDTYYSYVKENPEFAERVKSIRNRPILSAREKVVKEIKTDVNTAKWYLERKKKNEFAARSEVTGGDGESLVGELLKAYGIKEGKQNDREDDEAVPGSSKSKA